MNKKAWLIFLPIGLLLVVLVFLNLAIPSFSWLSIATKQKEIDALTKIEAPLDITIGTKSNGEFTPFDLGKIDVEATPKYREYVFCVWSTSDNIEYYTYFAHTTNIGLKFHLYEAKVFETGVDSAQSKVTYLGVDYSRGDEIAGGYLNPKSSDNTKAEFDDMYYRATYGHYQNVDQYGIPLYWKSESTTAITSDSEHITVDGDEVNCNYYVLRVDWDSDEIEFNRKETDMFYIMVSSE